METRAHHVLIGLFTVLLVIGGLLFALWLAKSQSDRSFGEYEVVFEETVTGLSKGSAVEYNGIRIGDVVALWLDPDDPRKVRARIRVAAGSPIKQDTRARLSITGVTGTAIIQLLGGTPESPPLRTRPDQPAVIVADPSPIAKLMSGGEDLITSITRLLDQANRMFSEANITRFGQIVVNIEQATGNLADQSGGLDQAMTRLNASLNHASGVLRSLDGLLDQEGRQILRQALATMNSLQRSSREVENLLVENRDSLESGMQGLAGLGPMLQDLGESLDSLRTFSRRLEQNPAGFLLQRDTLEEFRP